MMLNVVKLSILNNLIWFIRFMKVVCFNLLFFLFISSVFGQSLLSGKVKDRKGEPLPYANIGVKGGKVGTVSLIDGTFSISIVDSLLNDSLTFSSIGFKDKTFKIRSLITSKANLEIILDEKIISLEEVKISNRKPKRYKLGITGRTPMVYIPTQSYGKNDMAEQARLIHLKKPARLINANIFVLSGSMTEVSIRLNFYKVENGLPGERLVEKSIIRKATLKNSWFSIDLSEEDIYLDEDFVVAFEYLPSAKSSIVFGAKLGASDSFFRSSSQGLWRKNRMGGCSIYVTAEI
ncbi:MAG: carboxypeptidase-like regulatory domain-containing protein [Bacteroidia bacterium]